MYTTKKKEPCWQLQEAKAMFSKVVKSSAQEPQVITVHGKETAVVISIESYRKFTEPGESLVSFMEQSPLAGIKLEIAPRS